MTYLPGGRINATISGNTAGAGALVSTGTLTLAGGNNITLSQAGNAITISGPSAAAAASQTLGMSNLGNTVGTSGAVSGSAVRYLFAGGNNVTLSQSLNGVSGTVTISAANQTAQTQNLHNVTLTGNTAGVMAQISSGTLSLAGGNNVTLSQNGNAVTISGGAQSVQTQNVHNVTLSGNTAGVMAQISSGTLSLAGGNNVTLSQNGNAVTISAAAQSAQTQSVIQGVYDGAASITTGTVRFSNANGVSFGINGQTITASHNGITSQTNQAVGLYALGNTTQNSSTVLDARSLSFNALGNATMGYSNGSIQVSVAGGGGQSVQTQNLFNLTLSGNTAGVMAQVSSGTLTLAGGNNVTLSQNGNAVTVSAANQTVQTQNLQNVTLSGNTAGAMANVSSGALTLAGGNNVTLSQNGNAVTISAASQTVQTQNVHNITLSGNTAGVMAQISSGTLNLAGGANITLSQNGNSVSIIGGAGGGGGGIALANSQTTYTSGTANLIEGGGAITIASTTGQSFKVSVPATSSLMATGAVSISTNGSTVSIGAPVAPTFATLSRYEYPEGFFTSLSTQGQGSLSINHVYIPFYATGTAMKIGGSLSGLTNTSTTTASANITLWMGIYTLTGSTLSLASSGSANNGFAWSQTNSSSANTSINSMRQMTVPMNVNITPGEYWVAAVISSATTYTNFAYTLYGNNLLNTSASAAILTPIGSNTSANRDAMLFQGVYTANTAAGPTTIVGSQINNTSASNVMRANFYWAVYNATY